ncbi:MAG: Zn-ribbon domain-containing OB-fold protein [Candidatus Binatia bacterium]
MTVLPSGLPAPLPARDGLDRPYWEGTLAHELRVQRCRTCEVFRWGPEWICHACRSLATEWVRVDPIGRIHAWERVWHAVHPALVSAVPYVVLLVELPHAGGVRMIGNLAGDPRQSVRTGAPVRAVFEDHRDHDPPYTLVHWRIEEESK